MMLYPLKFKSQVLPKVWGSESWGVSCYGEYVSEVENGPLAGNSLQDLLEIYMADLVGDSVYEQYGNYFPLLAKFIDAKDDLSVQVHPDDETAYDRHREFGKNEMWYVMDAEQGATLTVGFTRNIDMEELQDAIANHTVPTLLQRIPVQQGDVVFIPAGMVHSINRGVTVAEIQESSDITYRIYDYNRLGLDGKLRALHIEEAIEVIDYTVQEHPKLQYDIPDLGAVNLVSDSHFTTNLLCFSQTIERDYAALDSFVIYMCVEGEVLIEAQECKEKPLRVCKGEAVLLPACLNDVRLTTNTKTRLLENYVTI